MKLEEMVGKSVEAHVDEGDSFLGTYQGRDAHGYWIQTPQASVFIPWERLDRLEFKITP